MATTSTEKGRIEEALGKYNLDISDEDVKAADHGESARERHP